MFDVLKLAPLHLYYLLKYLLFRIFFLHPESASYIREKCKNNILFWFEFYVSFPEAPSKTPFIFKNYRYKKEYIKKLAENLKQGRGLIVSKSENMGATELTALVLLWYWLFYENSNFVIFGRTSREVFRGTDPNTIFCLYRYVLDRLPPMLIHPRLKEDQQPYKLIINRRRQFCAMLINPLNGNRLYGYSGARINYLPANRQFKAAWFDDMAFQKHQETHLAKLKSIPVIATSCPNGTASVFYDLTQEAAFDQYTLHWADNPDCDEAWHKHILETADPIYIEQFLNINFDYKYKKPPVARLVAADVGEKKKRKPRKPRRKQQSSFVKTFAGAQQSPVKRVHFNKKEKPAVISFDAYRERRAKQPTAIKIDSIAQAISIINYVSRDMVVYNHTVLLKNPVFIAALRDQG
jgi:hypothetical protein